MTPARLGLIGLALASATALTGCYDDYGYGGVAVGYGPGYDGYYDGYYGGYGDPYFGTGYPGYYGWYGGFYYPGSGYYVYDRYRRPFRWNGDQRRYWSGQGRAFNNGAGYRGGANWGGFNRGNGFNANGNRPAGQAFRSSGNFGGNRGGFGGGRGGGFGGGRGHR